MTGKSALYCFHEGVTEALCLDRLMHWLSKVRAVVGNTDTRELTEMPSPRGKQQPAWGRSREFEITTRSVGRNQLNQSTTGDLDDEEMDEEDEDEIDHGRRKRKVAFLPSPGEELVRSALAMT
jgi:hypothetical protein